VKTPITILIAALCTCILIPGGLLSQSRRCVIISPLVGSVIDSSEARTYILFPAISNLQSASFYQAADSTLTLTFHRNTADSTITIPYSTAFEYAERIDHWEELREGQYRMGTSPPRLFYDDGTPLIVPSVTRSGIALSPSRFLHEKLPLAPNPGGLDRPKFGTIRFGLEAGIMHCDLSSLASLAGNSGTTAFPMSFKILIPILEDPSLSFMGGWGMVIPVRGGGSLTQFSAYLVLRPYTHTGLNPMIGLGAGRTVYSYTGPVIIDAEESYPEIVAGISLAGDMLDLLVNVPLAGEITTTFESTSYTITPAGPGVSLMLTF
jgi:hypothetical protein